MEDINWSAQDDRDIIYDQRSHGICPRPFFGQIKKRFRQTFVSPLDDLMLVVKNSMVTGKNIAQLTKSSNGSRLLFWLDWKAYLTKYNLHAIPKITDYHHSPGVVFVRDAPPFPFIVYIKVKRTG